MSCRPAPAPPPPPPTRSPQPLHAVPPVFDYPALRALLNDLRNAANQQTRLDLGPRMEEIEETVTGDGGISAILSAISAYLNSGVTVNVCGTPFTQSLDETLQSIVNNVFFDDGGGCQPVGDYITDLQDSDDDFTTRLNSVEIDVCGTPITQVFENHIQDLADQIFFDLGDGCAPVKDYITDLYSSIGGHWDIDVDGFIYNTNNDKVRIISDDAAGGGWASIESGDNTANAPRLDWIDYEREFAWAAIAGESLLFKALHSGHAVIDLISDVTEKYASVNLFDRTGDNQANIRGIDYENSLATDWAIGGPGDESGVFGIAVGPTEDYVARFGSDSQDFAGPVNVGGNIHIPFTAALFDEDETSGMAVGVGAGNNQVSIGAASTQQMVVFDPTEFYAGPGMTCISARVTFDGMATNEFFLELDDTPVDKGGGVFFWPVGIYTS